jgi:protein-tyrosine-phosphatase
MFGRKKNAEADKKISVLFVDELNDLQSQAAEYFLKSFYKDTYDVRSAGPGFDCVDCDMVSMMYRGGHDIRGETSKDFTARTMLVFDYIVFLQKETYDRIHKIVPFDGKQILMDFGSKNDFEATDDASLAECYSDLIERVRKWVKETFSDPGNLEKLVI